MIKAPLFVDPSRPALPAVAALLADAYAHPRGLAMEDVVVVVPGSRAVRRLQELLVEESNRVGLPLRPPRIVRVHSLSGILAEPDAPVVDPVLARRLWARALRESDPALLAGVFPALPEPHDIVGWDRLAGQLQRLHAEVGAGGHRFRDVAAICGGAAGLLHDDRERWHVLALVQDRYADLVETLGRSDPELTRIRQLDTGPGPFTGDIWLVGVVDIPTVVRRLVSASDARVQPVIHADAAQADAFDELGCVLPERWADRDLHIPDVVLRIADTPAGQADTAVREIASAGDGLSVDEVTIAAADTSLVPFLEQHLEAAGAPARYAGGRPLARSAPYRLLLAVADYLSNRTWDSFAHLIRHPDLAPGGRMARLADADRYHGTHLPASVAGVLPGTGRVHEAVVEARDGLEAPAFLGRLKGSRRLSAWMGEILGVLAEVHGRWPLDRSKPEGRRLLEALETLRSTALAYHRLPAEADESCRAEEAIRLLLASTGEATIADEPDPDAVDLVGWLEVHLDDAPFVVVAGFNESFLPESVGVDAFLPDGLRRALGLVDDELRFARDFHHLETLLRSHERVRLIAGRMDSDGNPLRPSRLMLACRGETLARRVRQFAGEAEAASASTAYAGHRVPAATSAFELPPERTLVLPPPDSLRITDFKLLIEDPYRYALERLLGLEAVDDAAREMDGASFGALAHQVLEEFGYSPEIRSHDARAIADRLDQLLDAAAARQFGPGALPAVVLQIEQLRARLHAFARWQAKHVSDGWEVVRIEGRPAGIPPGEPRAPAQEISFAVGDDEPVTLRGRIDRIDRHRTTGEWLLLDYKTSDTPQDPEQVHGGRNGDWRDLQLPLYRHLAAALTDDSGAPLIPADAAERVRLGYILLPRQLEQVGLRVASWTAADLESADEVARSTVRLLRRGVFEFDPERARKVREGPMAALLGGRLLTATALDDESEFPTEEQAG